jgi:FG-GAP-like repeat
VVSNNGDGVVSELLGSGNGTFQTPRRFNVPQADSISLADFNRDGNTDLVVTGGDLSDIALLLGDGTGNFTPAKKVPSGRAPNAVLAGEIRRVSGDIMSSLSGSSA